LKSAKKRILVLLASAWIDAASAQTSSIPEDSAVSGSSSQQTTDPKKIGSSNLEPVIVKSSGQPLERVGITRTVGRTELERYKGETLLQILGRQDSVFAINGQLFVRGQSTGVVILWDGQTPPKGFSLENLSTEQVQRVEIYPTGNPQFSAAGQSGVINIISRKASPKETRESAARIELAEKSQVARASYAYSNGQGEDSLSFNTSLFRLEGTTPRTLTRLKKASEAFVSSEVETDTSHVLWNMLDLGMKASRDQIGGGQLTFSLNFTASNVSSKDSSLIKYTPEQLPVEATTMREHYQRGSAGRANINWQRTVQDADEIDLNFAYKGNSDKNRSKRIFSQVIGIEDGIETAKSVAAWQSVNLSLSYKHKYSEYLMLNFGLNYERRKKRNLEESFFNQVSLRDPFDNHFRGIETEKAAYVRMEWEYSKSLSFELGSRIESVFQNESGGNNQNMRYKGTFFAPQLQLLYKPAQLPTDQVRVDLSRSWVPPLSLASVVNKMSVNNSFFNPDDNGNPQINPETYTSATVEFLRRFSATDSLGVTLIGKRGQNVLVTKKRLANGRWLVANENASEAVVLGLEVSTKTTLVGLLEQRDVDLRTRLGIFNSKIRDIPGPNNRLRSQLPFQFAVNLDQKRIDNLWTFGASTTYIQKGELRMSAFETSFENDLKSLETYATKKFPNGIRVRFGIQHTLGTARTSQTLVFESGNNESQDIVRPNPTRFTFSLNVPL
jgi:outer membrane receptor for ferrienterochelin and colicins